MTNLQLYLMGWKKIIASILPIVPLIIGWVVLMIKIERGLER